MTTVSDDMTIALAKEGKYNPIVLAVRHGPAGDPTYLVDVETDAGYMSAWLREGQSLDGVEWQTVGISGSDAVDETHTDPEDDNSDPDDNDDLEDDDSDPE